jgi:hypothetical protein
MRHAGMRGAEIAQLGQNVDPLRSFALLRMTKKEYIVQARRAD